MAQTIIVDTTPGFRMPTIFYSQGDIGRTFSIDLRSRFGDSLPASPTITIQATKPSGLGFSVAATSISNSVATFTVTDTMTNEAGRFPAEIKVVKDSVTLYTANFYIECEESAHPEGTTDGDLDSILPKYVSVTTTTLAAGASATYSYDPATNTATFGIPKGADGSLGSDILAPTYSSSNTYDVGDYVYYNGDLYICSTEISTAEAWTAGHWTQVTVSGEFTDLKDDLNSAIIPPVNVFDIESATTGKYLDGASISDGVGAFYTDYIPFTSSDYIKTPKQSGTYPRTMVLYDQNKTRLGGVNPSDSGEVSTYTTSAVATRYIRLNGDLANIDKFMVVKNTNLPSSYVPYDTASFVTSAINASATAITRCITEIDPTIIKGMEQSENLFNPYSVADGYYLNPTTGVLVPDASMCVSDYIKVKPSTYYVSNTAAYHYAWFDADYNYISGASDKINGYSPANAAYVRQDCAQTKKFSIGIYKALNTVGGPNSKYGIWYPWLDVKNISAKAFDHDGSYFVNLFNKYDVVEGLYINPANGSYGTSETYFSSNPIEVKPSTEYKIGEPLNRYAEYDKDMAYITGANLSGTNGKFTTNANTKYVCISGLLEDIDEFMLCESANYPNRYVGYGIFVPWIKNTDAALSKYAGKNLVCFGDSITQMGYTSSITSSTGINAENVGLSSGRYAYVSDPIKDAFSFYRIAYAISTGDWTIPESISSAAGYESVYQNILKIENTDFSNVDFASIAYGTNDFSSGTAIDNANNPLDTNTFKGAIRYSLKLITEKYPHIKIIGVTPCYRFWSENGVIIDDCDTHEIDGKKISDYVNAIKEVYTEYHLPVLDNLNNAGINKFNRLEYFGINDGLHPNDNGRNLIGQRIGNKIIMEY